MRIPSYVMRTIRAIYDSRCQRQSLDPHPFRDAEIREYLLIAGANETWERRSCPEIIPTALRNMMAFTELTNG